MKLSIFTYGYVNWDKVFTIINDLHPSEIICDGTRPYTALENYCLQNGIEFVNHPNSSYEIIQQSDRLLVSYEKSLSIITANCNKSLADTVVEIAWRQSKPVKIIEEVEYPSKPVYPTESRGMVHIIEDRLYSYERKDRLYKCFAEYHFYYEIPELIDTNVNEYILLTIYGEKYRIKIKSLDFNWIECLLEKNYSELYNNKLKCYVSLRYYKKNTNLLLYSSTEHSLIGKEEKGITIKELFDNLWKSDYAPCQKACSGNAVPILKPYKVPEPKNYNPNDYVILYYPYFRFNGEIKKTIESKGPNYYMQPNDIVWMDYPTTHLYDSFNSFEECEPICFDKYVKYRKNYDKPNLYEGLPF